MDQRGRLRRGAAIVGLISCLGLGLTACESETRIDPEQERNVPPGLREEGTPRDEEN